jgi:DNA-binding beta-propeller fold protein YncE
VDVAGGRALVMVQSPSRLLEVDLVTGDRTLLSGDGTGAGPELNSGEVAFDLPNARAIVTSRFAVQAVDLATGDRTTLASNTVGSGPDFTSSFAQDAALDPGGKHVWIVDFTRSAVLLLDLASGDRVIVAQ